MFYWYQYHTYPQQDKTKDEESVWREHVHFSHFSGKSSSLPSNIVMPSLGVQWSPSAIGEEIILKELQHFRYYCFNSSDNRKSLR
jgi:hypothetical protein